MRRRDFLKMAGVASGVTLLSSCGSQKEKEFLIPYLVPPEDEIIPGQAVFYRATCMECPAGCGLSVRVREGWPVKLEGIAGHPINDGALCMRGQASLSRLYQPGRLRNPVRREAPGKFKEISWEEALTLIADSLGRSRAEGCEALFLPARITGSLSALLDLFCRKLGIERLPGFEIFSHSAIREGNGVLFQQREIPSYRIEKADFLLSLGADLLETFVSPVSHAVQYARAKREGRLKWFHIEPHISLSGLKADGRWTILPGSEPFLLIFLLRRSLRTGRVQIRLPESLRNSVPDLNAREVSGKTGLPSEDLEFIAGEFERANHPLLIAGGVSTAHRAGLETAVLAGLIQWATGMIPSLIDFPACEDYSGVGSLLDAAKLNERLAKGNVGVLFVAKTNPLAQLPSLSTFRENFRKGGFRAGFSDFMNGTMEECDVVLPLSHPLESWGDAQPRKGLRTILQPVLKPLHNARSEGDILLDLMEKSSGHHEAQSYQEYLFREWAAKFGDGFLESFLKQGYHEEIVQEKEPTLDEHAALVFLKEMKLPETSAAPVLLMVPSIRTFDGRSQDLPLLQEIPDPLTTVSYGSWCSVGKGTARENRLEEKGEVLLSSPAGTLKLPVKIQHGLPDHVCLVQSDILGLLSLTIDDRTGELIAGVPLTSLRATGETVSLPVLSGSESQKGRGIIPYPFHKEERHERTSLYPKHDHKDYRWVMAIDLDLCSGCSSCVAACYIENNIPVVGTKDHLKGREMSWIRIEPEYRDGLRTRFVPMFCQQCDNAPCEAVCPVYATYHNPEGLNAQVYNRCVGTRYCSNNCPYKARRFNWYQHDWPAPLDRMLSPDLSSRGRGVMEKCTFCVQRIREAKDRAKDQARLVQDGEVTPACAQSCPTGAIIFGNLRDENSRVYRLIHSRNSFRVFEHLGTEPAVYYLEGREERGKQTDTERSRDHS